MATKRQPPMQAAERQKVIFAVGEYRIDAIAIDGKLELYCNPGRIIIEPSSCNVVRVFGDKLA